MISSVARKALRKAVKAMNYGRTDSLQEKAALAEQIKSLQKGDLIALVVWQMDCDCASWTQKIVVPATVAHVSKVLESIYDGAEGPVTWRVDNPSVVVERNSRDHAAEAFEDGHPYSVTY